MVAARLFTEYDRKCNLIFSFMILLTLKTSLWQITLIIEPLRYSMPLAAKINRCIGSNPRRTTD